MGTWLYSYALGQYTGTSESRHLQGAGLCPRGTQADTITHIYNTAIRPVLSYGVESVHLSKDALRDMD